MSTKIDKNFNTSGSYKKFTLDNLRRFVIRARIVQEHSLASDIGKLNKEAYSKVGTHPTPTN